MVELDGKLMQVVAQETSIRQREINLIMDEIIQKAIIIAENEDDL